MDTVHSIYFGTELKTTSTNLLWQILLPQSNKNSNLRVNNKKLLKKLLSNQRNKK